MSGHFWAPEEPDKQVRGRLTWSAAEGGELTLEGILAPGGSLASVAPTLLGRTLGQIPVVLVDCFVRRAVIAAEITQRWRVNSAYVGTSTADLRANMLALEIDGLAAFMRASGLSVQGSLEARDPVHITWTRADPPVSLTVGDTELEVVDERRLLLEKETQFGVEHQEYLRLKLAQDEPWEQAAERLSLMAALFEFLADRPMPVRRQWRPGEADEEDVDRFFQPILGTQPRDPDRVWLTVTDVRSNLERALHEWTQLFDVQPGIVDLIIEEVRFRRSTNVVDRILRLTRILELFHRHRHPEAVPDDDDELERVEAVMDAVPESLRGWLGDRLGVTLIRLRQRIRETVAELSGIESQLVDVDMFARTATKTRNLHTHYGDRSGVAEGEYATYLAMRLWLLVRGVTLLTLGWSPTEALALVSRDREVDWLAGQPLISA